jgi:flagellar hook-length control protein FliK
MSVAPDLLLRQAPEVKPKPAAQKPPEAAAQPQGRDSASFSDVYARQRQERSDDVAGERGPSDTARKTQKDEDKSAKQTSSAEQPVVAEGGNVLPVEPAQPDNQALLLLGLAASEAVAEGEGEAEAQPAVADEALTELDAALESDAIAQQSSASLMAATAVVDAARIDPQLQKLSSAALGKLVMDADGKAAQAGKAAGAVDVKTEAEVQADPEPGFEALLSGALEGEQQAGSELTGQALRGAGAEAPRETAADARPEAFAGKLNALAQAMGAAQPGARGMPLVPGQPVAMQQGGWSEAVVDRVMWLSSQNLKSAEIQLDPADLGRLEVRVSLNQDTAQVTFASANPNVRDALESQLHRLRELFSQQGMNQLDVNVSDQSLARGWQGQGEGRQGRGDNSGGDLLGDDVTVVGESAPAAVRAGRGLVDYYA